MTLLLSSKSSRVKMVKMPQDSSESLPADKSNIRLYREVSLGESVVNDRKELVALNNAPNENQVSTTHQNEKHKSKIRKTFKSTKGLFKKSRWLRSDETSTEVKVERDLNLNQERVPIYLSETQSLPEDSLRESIQEAPQVNLSTSSALSSPLSALQSGFCELSPSVFRFPMHIRNILLVRSILRYLLSRKIIKRRSKGLNEFEEEPSEVTEAAKSSTTASQRGNNSSHQSALIKLLRRIKSLTKLLTSITKKLRTVARDFSPRNSYHTDADDELNSQNESSELNSDSQKSGIKGVMSPLEYGELSYINGNNQSENTARGKTLDERQDLFVQRMLPLYSGRFIEGISGDDSGYDSSEVSSSEDSIESYQLREVEESQANIMGDNSSKKELASDLRTSRNTLKGDSLTRSRPISQTGAGDIQIRRPHTRNSMCVEVVSDAESEFTSEAPGRDSILSAQIQHQQDGLEFDTFGDDTSYIAYLQFAATEEAGKSDAESTQAKESSSSKRKFSFDSNNVESQELTVEDLSEKNVQCNFRPPNHEDLQELTAIRRIISEDVVSLCDSAGISFPEITATDYTGSVPLKISAVNLNQDFESTGNTEFEPSSFGSGTLEAIVEEEAEEIFREQIMTSDARVVSSGNELEQEYYNSIPRDANLNPNSNSMHLLETIEEVLEMSPGFSINLAIVDHSDLESALLKSATANLSCELPTQFGKKIPVSSSFKDFRCMDISKIASHNYSPCTRTSKKWGDYSEFDLDDLIFEQFFASHGKLCPPKPHSIKPESSPSITHSSPTAFGPGSVRKFDCCSTDLTSPDYTGYVILSLQESKHLSSQKYWRKISLEELFDSTSNLFCNDKEADVSDKRNQLEDFKENNNKGYLTSVEIESLLLALNTENAKRKEILSCNTDEIEEHGHTLSESNWPSICDLQGDSFPITTSLGIEIKLSGFRAFSDLSSELRSLRVRSKDACHSQDHSTLKEVFENYRHVFLYLIKYVVLPCNFQIRVLIEKILQARRKEKELVSLETGATNEITDILQEFEKNIEPTSTFWEGKLDSIGSNLNGIDKLYKTNKGDLDVLENKSSQEITLIMSSIRYIRNIRNEVLTAFYQNFEQLESQEKFQKQDIQHFIFADYFQNKTVWYSQLDLEEFQSILTGNLNSLFATMKLVQQRKILIHENLSRAKRTIITGPIEIQKSQSEDNLNENKVAGDKSPEHTEPKTGKCSGKKVQKKKRKTRTKNKKCRANKKIKNKR